MVECVRSMPFEAVGVCLHQVHRRDRFRECTLELDCLDTPFRETVANESDLSSKGSPLEFVVSFII